MSGKNSIWPSLSSKQVDRSLRAHSIMGLAISALLFIVCLSGTVAVFEDELGWWELPSTPMVTSVSPEAAQNALERAVAQDEGTTHAYLYLPRENWPRFVVATDNDVHAADATGQLVGGYETAWNDFLIHLHYYLHLPETFGMVIVAILGVFLVSMAISGVLAHPRIFRDAFRLKRLGGARIVQADLHNRMSVWTAPFHIIVAATGAMIGLFAVVAYVLALSSFEGDTRALSEAVFGEEPPVNKAPAPMARMDTAMTNLAGIAPDAPAFLAILHDPGTQGQHIGIYGEHMDRLIYGETYEFTAEGDYTGHQGASDGELGQQIANSMYRAHFGDFGSHWMKIAYFVLGGILCVIISSGMNIYFVKSAEKGNARPRMEAGWSGFVWGSCCMLAVTLALALLGSGAGLLTPIFWIGTIVISLAAAMFGQAGRAGNVLRPALGALLVICGVLHISMHSASYGNLYIAFTTVVIIIGGLGLLGYGLKDLSAIRSNETRAA